MAATAITDNMDFSIIAAVDDKGGLAKNGQMPWQLPSELKYFKAITIGTGHNAIIMGRKTWQALPEKNKPLKNRLNVILSRQDNLSLPKRVIQFSSLDQALNTLKQKNLDRIFVIGGGEVFKEAVNHKSCSNIYLTKISQNFNCDIFMPKIDKNFTLEKQSQLVEENGLSYCFLTFTRSKSR